MSRILFLNPPCYGEHWHLNSLSGGRWPAISPNTIDKEPLKKQKDYYYAIFPFPLSFASTIFKSQGHTTKVLDALNLNLNYKETYEAIKEFKPDMVYIESCAVSFNQDIQMLNNIKSFMNIDVYMIGSVVRAKKSEIPKHINYIEGNYLKHFGGDNYVDLLTEQERDDSVLMYNDYHSFGSIIKKPQLQIWNNIGCPYGCTFCLTRWTMWDGKVAFRSIDHIREEIRNCVSRWGFKSVLFDSDTFNIGDVRTVAIAKMMGKEFPGLQWSAMVRADSCSLETFKVMRDNGCISLKVGVETFSPTVLKRIGKGLESEELIERILKLWDMGYFVYLSTMMGIMGETKEEEEQTNTILKELNTMGIHSQRPQCLPLPGTKMGEEFQNFELLKFGDNVPDFEYGNYEGNGKLMERITRFTKECK